MHLFLHQTPTCQDGDLDSERVLDKTRRLLFPDACKVAQMMTQASEWDFYRIWGYDREECGRILELFGRGESELGEPSEPEPRAESKSEPEPSSSDFLRFKPI